MDATWVLTADSGDFWLAKDHSRTLRQISRCRWRSNAQ